MKMQLHRLTTVAVCLGFVAAACSGSDTAETTAATTTSATTRPTAATQIEPTTTTSELSEESSAAAFDAALSVKDDFFVAFNSGDADAVLGLFLPDAFEDGEWFEQLLVWNIAQGTRYTPSNCQPGELPDSDSVEVTCRFKTHDALSLAVDGPPVPFTMTIHVTPDGISRYRDQFGSPDFNTVGIPFDRWMDEHHPQDAEAAAFASWDSVEEAKAIGAVVAIYAQEWATYLQENDCTYRDGC
jgi:hypothetical protein